MPHIDWPFLAAYVAAVPLVWLVAGWLKLRGHLREGDARKLCHAAALVGGALWFGRLPVLYFRPTLLWAGIVLLAILLVVCRLKAMWPFSLMFAGYARQSDAPREGFHVWFSWLASMAGLVLVDGLFANPQLTQTSILVLGLADAVAEPIGSRWGRYRYPVPALYTGPPTYRSLEGSAAVAIVTWLTILIFHPASETDLLARILLAAIVALSVALTEAFTPHGLDNLTIPLVCAAQMKLLMTGVSAGS